MSKVSGKHGKGSGGGGKLLLVGFGGLVIGVLIAFGVVLYLYKTPLPFEEKAGRPEHDAVASQARNGMPLPGKPGDKPVEKPRFEFYKILPGAQEATPGDNAAAAPAQEQAPEQPVATEQFYLQIGAFQKAADADNLKAKLALIGVEAGVQDVVIADKGTLHRVRTGPYATPTEMNQARTLMAQNGVQATVIKIKGAGNQSAAAESKSTKP